MSKFQSTRPARGATRARYGFCLHERISIHAPREGRDLIDADTAAAFAEFQSTRPARGATYLSDTEVNL